MSSSIRVNEDGSELYVDHISTKSGDRIYTCVVDSEGKQRSVLWRFAAHKNDVYAGPRMEDHKLSLHASGECRWAYLTEVEPGKDRAFMKWKRPPASEAVYIVFKVVIPEQYLSVPRELERDRPLSLKLPMPPKGGATELMVAYSTLRPDKLIIPRSTAETYMAMRLKNGDWVYLVPRTVIEFSHPQVKFPMILGPGFREKNGKITDPINVHMHLYCEPNEHGVGAVIELNNLKLSPPTKQQSS